MPLNSTVIKGMMQAALGKLGFTDSQLAKVGGRIIQARPLDHFRLIKSDVVTGSRVLIAGLPGYAKNIDSETTRQDIEDVAGAFLYGRINIQARRATANNIGIELRMHTTHSNKKSPKEIADLGFNDSYPMTIYNSGVLNIGASVMIDFALPATTWALELYSRSVHAAHFCYTLSYHNNPSPVTEIDS